MTDAWFTEPNEFGEVLLTWRGGSWYVKAPGLDSDVKCLLQGDVDIDSDDSPELVRGTAVKYMRGSEEMPDFLYLRSEEITTKPEDDPEATETKQQASQNKSRSSTQRRDLVDFIGSGDYVTVEAVVDSVFWVKKQTRGVPDIKGKLTDDSVREGVTFVVNDGVNHPYLEEGTRFEFRGVKDHYYSENAEVQVMITEQTDFIKKRDTGHSGSASANSSSRHNRSASKKNLHNIAKEQIGNKEFTMSQEDQESAVGKAKKRARKQQRDPAIDPKLQGGKEDDN